MKLKSNHIVAGIFILICGFVAVAILNRPQGTAPMANAAPGDNRDARPQAADVLETEPEAPAAAGPVIELEADSVDLKNISNSEITNHYLAVRNAGSEDLRIDNVSYTCGCTKIYWDSEEKILPPGGEGQLRIEINPMAIRGGFESTKNVNVFSNDPERPNVTIPVHVTIEPEFEFVPAHIDFGAVERGSDVPEQTVLVRQLGASPIFNVEPVGAAQQFVTTSFEMQPEATWASPGHPEYLVHITLDPPALPGSSNGQPVPVNGIIVVKPKEGRLATSGAQIPVTAMVSSPYSLSAGMISHAQAEAGQQNVASVTVSSEMPVEISDVEVEPPEYETNVTYNDDKTQAIVSLGLKADATPGMKRGTMSLKIHWDGNVASEELRLIGLVTDPAAADQPVPPRG